MKPIILGKGKNLAQIRHVRKQQVTDYSKIKRQKKINKSNVINRMQTSNLNKDTRIWSQIACIGESVYTLRLFGPKQKYNSEF